MTILRHIIIPQLLVAIVVATVTIAIGLPILAIGAAVFVADIVTALIASEILARKDGA